MRNGRSAFERGVGALFGALLGGALGVIVSAGLILAGVEAMTVLIAVPVVGAVIGALGGDRGLMAMARMVGIFKVVKPSRSQ